MSLKKQNPGRIKETDLRVFEILGIRMLNKLIMATIGKAVLKVNPREKMPSYFVGHPFDKNSLLITKRWLFFNEMVHFFLILLCAAIGYFFYEKEYGSGIIIILFAIILNFSLFLMQCMNRKRIREIIIALNKREKITPHEIS